MKGVTWKPRGLAEDQQRKISSERVSFYAAVSGLPLSVHLRCGTSIFYYYHFYHFAHNGQRGTFQRGSTLPD